jgi:ATP-dependent protease HslVU (ClpYQ) ATPase subunit
LDVANPRRLSTTSVDEEGSDQTPAHLAQAVHRKPQRARRGSAATSTSETLMLGDDEGPLRYTEAEAAMLAKLADVRVRADGGDKKAKAQIKKVEKQLTKLQKRARKGDVRAARAALVLEESGLLVPSQTFAMEGIEDVWSWKIGGFNVLNAGLIVTSAALLWKRKWLLAAIPVGAITLHEGRQKHWW